MSDRRLRELERRAALGDPQASDALQAELQRVGGFAACVTCGYFFPSWVEHSCDRLRDRVNVTSPLGARVKRAMIFDSEFEDFRTSQTSFFVNFAGFCSLAPRSKYWGVDTNLQGMNGLPYGHAFAVHRVAALLPAGCDAERRNWMLNNTYIQLRFASREEPAIPGLLCYRDEESSDWIMQIAGGPPDAVPVEERRGNEGLRGVDLTVNGRPGLVLHDLSAFRVIMGHVQDGNPAGFQPLLVRMVLAGFMVRKDPV